MWLSQVKSQKSITEKHCSQSVEILLPGYPLFGTNKLLEKFSTEKKKKRKNPRVYKFQDSLVWRLKKHI